MILATSTLKKAPLYARHQSGHGAFLGTIDTCFFDPETASLQQIDVRKHQFFGAATRYKTPDIEIIRGRVYLNEDNEHPLSTDRKVQEGNLLLTMDNARVVTRSGMFVGNVADVYIEETSFRVVQLEVVKRILIFPIVTLLIARQDIIDILPRTIVVRDAVIEEADLVSLFTPRRQVRRAQQ